MAGVQCTREIPTLGQEVMARIGDTGKFKDSIRIRTQPEMKAPHG